MYICVPSCNQMYELIIKNGYTYDKNICRIMNGTCEILF